nr:putative reverse transcriptase domain-containing protein [Tanacetum cinerariifolium]
MKKKAKDKSREKRLEDVPIARDFPQIFPEDFPGLPSTRQFEFQNRRSPWTYYGHNEFHVIPFGLTNAPTVFMDLINRGEKKEVAFQLLKQILCSAPILALAKGSEDFMVYCDALHKRLGVVWMQREKVIAYASYQLKVHEKNYTTHGLELGAVANIVADALSQKERIKPLRVLALMMTTDLNLPSHILNAQAEAMKEENVKEENLCVMNKELRHENGDTFWQMGKDERPLYWTFQDSYQEPVEIMDREVKRLKKSCILIVKVRWNSRRSPKFNWKREDRIRKKYPHLFIDLVPSSNVTIDSEPWRFQWVFNEEPKAPAEAPPSPDYYLTPSDVEAPMEDHPLPDDASPTTISPCYVADSDPEEDPEEDPTGNLADGRDDDDDESSDDDDDGDNDDEEEQEASEDDDDDEEE